MGKRTNYAITLAVIAIVADWTLLSPRTIPMASLAGLESAGDAERGKVFFDAGGCASCHASPGQDDRLKLGGGLELKSPFGSFFAPNISPHPRDGIGAWKVADLVYAMKTGVSPTGQHYYPAFPYTTYANAKIADIADLMAYLRTLPQVAGKAPEHRLAFPFDIRHGVGYWKLVNFSPKALTNDFTHGPEWNRGRYLTEAFAHCAECHSARDAGGAVKPAYRYAGGPDPEGEGWVPNITQHENGIADWSAKDIAWMLKTGDTPDGDIVGGSMKSVVKNMAQLSDADREVIALYIKSLPARQSPPKPRKN